MAFAYINTRINGVLQESRGVFLTGENDKEKLTEQFNQNLKDHRVPPVAGQVNIGFKHKVDPFTFDISFAQPRK